VTSATSGCPVCESTLGVPDQPHCKPALEFDVVRYEADRRRATQLAQAVEREIVVLGGALDEGKAQMEVAHAVDGVRERAEFLQQMLRRVRIGEARVGYAGCEEKDRFAEIGALRQVAGKSPCARWQRATNACDSNHWGASGGSASGAAKRARLR
jgi:hypothetical protein